MSDRTYHFPKRSKVGFWIANRIIPHSISGWFYLDALDKVDESEYMKWTHCRYAGEEGFRASLDDDRHGSWYQDTISAHHIELLRRKWIRKFLGAWTDKDRRQGNIK